jgi:archaemetzincin
MPLTILPLLSISEKVLEDIKGDIGRSFLSKVKIAEPITSLPDSTYDKSREQYDAEKLVDFIDNVTKTLDSEKVLAVGNMDMFMQDKNFIFGVAQKGGRIGIISLYRLDKRFYGKPHDYGALKGRALKEAVHELGHCYGLEHCANDCVMSFSNDIMLVDQKPSYFCPDCLEQLRVCV